MPHARPAPADPAQAAPRAGLTRDLRKAWSKGPKAWVDLTRAVVELALANRMVRFTEPSRLGLMEQDQAETELALTEEQTRLVERVSYAVNVMALRVPWRSDCLIRAVAARRWLASSGIEARVGVGARRDEDGAFMAHAWLKVGDRLVTGGDISPYGEFVPRAR